MKKQLSLKSRTYIVGDSIHIRTTKVPLNMYRSIRTELCKYNFYLASEIMFTKNIRLQHVITLWYTIVKYLHKDDNKWDNLAY
jgi:hypothetical protein